MKNYYTSMAFFKTLKNVPSTGDFKVEYSNVAQDEKEHFYHSDTFKAPTLKRH